MDETLDSREMSDVLVAAVAEYVTELADTAAVSAFDLAGDAWSVPVRVGGDAASASAPDFVVRATDAVWRRVLATELAAGWQSILHLVRTGSATIEGDERSFFRSLDQVRLIVERARRAPELSTGRDRLLAARGSYARVTSALGTADVYVERCGSGPQLLALATAGSDTSQWHGLMTQTDLTDQFELITVDLPWHGRSSPAFGADVGDWRLTPESYTDFIVAAADEIVLDRPVLVGASMAGAAVVHAVATAPERFAGAVACQVGRRVANRASDLLHAADIDQSMLVPEWTYGLMNPASPRDFRTRVWWGYSSGGRGAYAADIDSYQQWDYDEIAHLLNDSSPHIAVLSGRFDTSVPPESSRDLADAIPNSSFVEMPELGHFPHAENPARFHHYLLPALERVQTPRAARRRVA